MNVSSWAYAHLLDIDMLNMNDVFPSILLTTNKKEQEFFLNACYQIQSWWKLIKTSCFWWWHISYTIWNASLFYLTFVLEQLTVLLTLQAAVYLGV